MYTQTFNCVENGRDKSITALGASESLLIDVRQLSQLSGFGKSTLYKMISSGRAPCPVKIGRMSRWRRRDVISWIESGCPACERF